MPYKPPEGAVEEAKRGLAWRKEFGRGGTAIGIARARDISNGKNLPAKTVKRMKAFFDRHQSDRKAEGWSPGEKGYPSNGRIAHALWGGDPGYSWAKKVVKQMESNDELRLIEDEPELRVMQEEGGKTVVRGYAALFRSTSKDLGGFREVIEPGAFDKVLSDPNLDVIAKLDHSRPLARTPKTLRLGVDERGLWYEFDPKKSDEDVVEALERGDLKQSSFAFRLCDGDDKWERLEDGSTLRTITNFTGLYDVGPVYTPAYGETSSYVSKRALDMVDSMTEKPDPLAGDIKAAREWALSVEVKQAIRDLS